MKTFSQSINFYPLFTWCLSVVISFFAINPLISLGHAASFSLQPNSELFKESCVSKIDIIVDTQGQSSNAADAVLFYNSDEIEIIDQINSIPGTQVKPGSIYEVYAGNIADVPVGHPSYHSSAPSTSVSGSTRPIRITAFSVLGQFNGSGVFASVFFRGKPGVSSTAFQFDFTPGESKDSNIADLNSADILNSASGGSYTFEVSPCVPDTRAPFVSNRNPNNGATDVPLDSDIILHIQDDSTGVDLSSVEIQVEGDRYITSSSQLSFTGDPLNYRFVINPDSNFPANTEITVSVRASDLAGNIMSPHVYRFNQPPPPPPAPPVCGNGIKESGEQCDDGNVGDGDGCDAFCKREPICGDGIVEDLEECEPPGSLVCDNSCKVVLQACLPNTPVVEVEGSTTQLVTQVSQSDFVQGFGDTVNSTFTSISQAVGISQEPQSLAGIDLASVETESFVCDDATVQSLELERVEVPYEPPAGYEVVKQPFQLGCSSGNYQTTISIPDNYYDVQAVKCVGGKCSDVELKSTQTIRCGQQEVLAQESQTESSAQIEVTALKQTFSSERYKVVSSANASVDYSLSLFDEPDGFQINPTLKVLSSPITISRKKSGEQSEVVEVSLPYVSDPQVDVESIKIYSFDSFRKSWQLVEASSHQNSTNTILAELDLAQLHGGKNQATFATMGVICDNCELNRFEPVYQPLGDPRAAVVLVHGLAGSSADWSDILDDVRETRQPWQVWVYNHSPQESLKDSAVDLARSVQIYGDQYDVLYFVGHHTGGLIVQEALSYANRENFINPNALTFVKKVEKAILIGTPNDPLEDENVLFTFYNYLVNNEVGRLFNLEDQAVKDLKEPRGPIPQVPGIDYFVIAGSEGIDAVESLENLGSASIFSHLGPGDGFVSVKSAQHVGGQYLNKQCENFYQVGANHLEMLKHPSSRKVIGRLISQDVSKALSELPLIGYQQYYQLASANCNSEDRYLLIGKKTIREKAPDDVLECGCGNGYCGVDEDSVSCPSDCATFFRKENYPLLYWLIGLPLAILLAYLLFRIWKWSTRKIDAYWGKKKISQLNSRGSKTSILGRKS